MNKLTAIWRNRVIQSLLFWAVSFFILLRVFTRTDEVRVLDLIYTGLFHIPLVIGVLVNQFYLNRYLDRQKYVPFVLGYLFSLILIVQTYPITIDLLAPVLFPDYYFVTVYEWYEMLGIGFIYVSFTTLLHFAKGWFRQQEDIARVARLEEEKKQSELQALRAQVNPHFLFNSLNTIYNEARKKSDKAPDLILKLSEMLRYVVEKMEQEKVPLEEEVEYLKNYIDLHKERLNEPQKVNFTMEGDFTELRIAPLLLIIFVENCFKHGDLTDEESEIMIELKAIGNQMTLHCRNDVYMAGTNVEDSSGTGIQNAKRRLELAYESRFSLDIKQSEDRYETTLKMELD